MNNSLARPARLIVFNYSMNGDSPVFSHQRDVVIRLSSAYERVLVFTLEKEISVGLPSNIEVVSIGWSPGNKVWSTLKVLFCLYSRTLLFRNSHVFSHMTEQVSALAAPLTKILRVRHLLWYAHASDSRALSVSIRLGVIPLTSTHGSFPKLTKQPILMGQAIEPSLFRYHARNISNSGPLRLVYFGRLDPSKQIDKLIKFTISASDLIPIEFDIFGNSTFGNEDYLSTLETIAASSPTKCRVTFKGNILRSTLGELLQNYDIFIHAFLGSLDKTLLEASCAGLPVLTCNSEYIREFSWLPWVRQYDPMSEDNTQYLLGLMMSVLNADKDDLDRQTLRASEYVIARHSLDSWVTKLILILNSKSGAC